MTLDSTPLSAGQIRWRWRILISTFLGYAGYYLTRKVFTICKAPLADQFAVRVGDIAHIWTAYLVAYMIGQFLSSLIGRKWGPRVLLLGGLGISILINIVFGFANSYWTFMAFMFVNGLVQATGWPGCVGSVAEWLRPAERGTIMGIWSTNYLVGNMLVKTIGGLLLSNFGWRHAFFGCTVVTILIWWVIYFWQRNRPEDVGLPAIIGRSDEGTHAIQASNDERITLAEYARLALNPIVLVMGASYFSIKFLRYALDSWLPTFLHLQGLDLGPAAYYSQVFDLAGLAGAILAGWVLDRWFRGNWALLCLFLGSGIIGGYLLVVNFGANPHALAFCFGVVGFMIYGPDTLLGGVAAVQVAGERNAVAVAGIVNGIGSIGPIIQEEVIGALMTNKDPRIGIQNANLLTLGMSIAFLVTMGVVLWRMHTGNRPAIIGAGAHSA
ncbi:MAG TPA: MFS transporter [Candidatus Nitrosotalea sp.]|nr:MFS transporter [Candidatus Nitrosotalea sp.]